MNVSWIAFVALLFAPAACSKVTPSMSSTRPDRSAAPVATQASATIRSNPSLPTVFNKSEPWARAGADSLTAYNFLLTETPLRLGDRCGIGGEVTDLWSSLSRLVNAGETAMLRDLTMHATTIEARAAAIIGLVKLRRVSKTEAQATLGALRGTLTTCTGCIASRNVPPSAIVDLFELPLADQSPAAD